MATKAYKATIWSETRYNPHKVVTLEGAYDPGIPIIHLVEHIEQQFKNQHTDSHRYQVATVDIIEGGDYVRVYTREDHSDWSRLRLQ